MIMDGRTLDFGAVVAVQNIMHPVSLARLVMEKTEHNMLTGKGAQQFARQMKVSEVDPRILLTSRELAFYEQLKNDPHFKTKNPFQPGTKGTVGAVAIDEKGNLAAATSTGGTPRKLPGRVGDSAIIGAGTFADNLLGACSATGWGEAILKSMLSKTACDLLDRHPTQAAARQAIGKMEQRVQGWGGLILIDKKGNYGFAHNTTKMAFAYVENSGEIIAKIKIDQHQK
jgi:beta-aspartyl-peptidase (threonine type)